MNEDENDLKKQKKFESLKKKQLKHAEFCQKNLDSVLKKDKKVIELLEKFEKYNCELPAGFIKCDPCLDVNDINGGYIPSYIDEDSGKIIEKSIVLCDTKVFKPTMPSVLRHELIHAFDDCTTNLNW